MMVPLAPSADILSMEALARHTAEGDQASKHRVRRSPTTTQNNAMLTRRTDDGSQPPMISPCNKQYMHYLWASVVLFVSCKELPAGQFPWPLSMSGSLAGDLGLVSCVLPEELLVDILTERLQLSDCHCGVIIDGLETVYSQSPARALQALLKAFNNRSFIYVINLVQTFEAFQAKEKVQREAEGKEGGHLDTGEGAERSWCSGREKLFRRHQSSP
ncbi:hydrocephalus-inducing protein homolog [Arapaima gigas]